MNSPTYAVLLLAFVTSGFSSADRPERMDKLAQAEHSQQPDPDSKAVREYWTPERLRNAKPMELPHPDRPIEGNNPAGQGSHEDSHTTGSGSPGSGAVPPVRDNVLVPPSKVDSK